mgnify:CR=1 FL=1
MMDKFGFVILHYGPQDITERYVNFIQDNFNVHGGLRNSYSR